MKKDYIEAQVQMGFTQAIAVEANGVKTIYVSGQTGSSPDLKTQSIEAFANLEKRLAAAGASPADVVKLTTYIVDYSPDKIRDAFAGQPRVFKDREHPPTNTVIGVQALFQPHLLLEVEAVAVVAVDSETT
jgi:enamine deaminase RidA (YjgF/YER057c/UK114 family)